VEHIPSKLNTKKNVALRSPVYQGFLTAAKKISWKYRLSTWQENG